MKNFKNRIRPQQTFNELVSTTCDMCGLESKRQVNWIDSNYEFAEVTVSLKEGTRYPEGNSGTEIQVDMCPGCFKQKLMAWLESEGCHINNNVWNY